MRHTQQPAFLLGLLPLAQTLGAEQAISTAQNLKARPCLSLSAVHLAAEVFHLGDAAVMISVHVLKTQVKI